MKDPHDVTTHASKRFQMTDIDRLGGVYLSICGR